MECLLYWFLCCETNIYVTDVIVTWSDVIDQLYYFFWPGVKLVQNNNFGSFQSKNQYNIQK